MAAALRDNGGGRIITTEFEVAKVARARENLKEAGLLDLVEIREDDALETLARDLPECGRSPEAHCAGTVRKPRLLWSEFKSIFVCGTKSPIACSPIGTL